MPNEVRLLVVEDNDADRRIWQQTIDRHNATCEDGDTKINLLVAGDVLEANLALANSQVDATVIDLRLDGNGREPENSAGNDLLVSVLAKKLAVTAILTGQPTDARIPEYARAQVKVFTKGGDDTDGIQAVMTWLTGQFPIILCIQDAISTIRNEMASVFNHSIWPRWKFWVEDPNAGDKRFLSASVARHIVSHVYESLSETMEGRAHAEEWYLLPPNPKGIRTGDLVQESDGNRVEVVITPRCDIATSKFRTIQLAQCDDISTKWDEAYRKFKDAQAKVAKLKEHGGSAEDVRKAEEEAGRANGKFYALVHHDGNRSAVHFLPRMKLTETKSVGPLLVRFDQIRSLSRDDRTEFSRIESQRFAALSPVFLPSLVERLGGFFSRIGTPDYHHFDDSQPTHPVP